MTWEEFLAALKEAGGSTDMQTSKTGRYPWLYHFCRGQAGQLAEGVVIYAFIRKDGKSEVLKSPPRNWGTRELLWADYAELKEHGGFFNDTTEALAACAQDKP